MIFVFQPVPFAERNGPLRGYVVSYQHMNDNNRQLIRTNVTSASIWHVVFCTLLFDMSRVWSGTTNSSNCTICFTDCGYPPKKNVRITGLLIAYLLLTSLLYFGFFYPFVLCLFPCGGLSRLLFSFKRTLIFTAPCTIVQRAVLRLHVDRPSVCPSICNVGGSRSHVGNVVN